jgi:YfiH family protein
MFVTHDQFKPKNICYGFFTKKLPNSTHRYFKHHDEHEANRLHLAKAFGSNNIAVVDQKHTNQVILRDDYDSDEVADGQITKKSNLALAVITADCVPILFADEEAQIIATVHAGWRGARTNIIQEAVIKLRSLGAKNIVAIIGPCIQQHSYEVDDNFFQDFLLESNHYKKFFIPSLRKKHHMFDLPGYVKSKLIDLNVENILDIERNTYDDEENFFSFRRTTHNPNIPMGNIASVIMLL